MYLCELLPRLGTISIRIALQESDSEPQISNIAFSHNSLQVITSRNKYVVKLPVEKAEKLQGAKITQLSADGKTLSLRLTLSDSEKLDSPFTSLAQSKAQRWSVSDLLKTPKDNNNVNVFKFICANCGTQILDSMDTKFADMPSEYWHELMDFWHCHKPHQEHHHNHQKNYESIVPKPGNVYIGAHYLFVKRKSSSCYGCKRVLGEAASNDTAKLYKWNLKLQYNNEVESYPPYAYAYYAILDKINSGALRKLQVKNSKGTLSLWILSVGLSVSYDNHILDRALKILYTEESNENLEVLELPTLVYESLLSVLQESTSLLPESEQNAQMSKEDKVHYKAGFLAPEMGDAF
ncbi:hypothetical protein ACNR91_000879 [Candidozyma auris]|uniref:Ubiquitin-conjugating enzyme E2C-binding protein n=1 Tax=Candidozyma auris TaxID=498019 RepID=A0A8F2W1P8_CANAR|nr:hypothetical protein QG37_04258 [[Candida] auris]QWW24049.1 hypothetical protein CA7LBN_002883 [[Candida] auris]